MIGPLLSRPSLRGIEARAGLESFAHHLCGALGLSPVTVVWTDRTTTAAISQRGNMLLSDIGDAETVNRATLSRYAGFVVHELLHRKFTDFKARDRRPYVDSLHNALEDAWIERRAIALGLTGNIEGLLVALVRGLVGEVPANMDWADPAQLPFSLAVFARRYGITIPVPAQVLPIWREASARLDACASSHDTLEVARWVFDQLQQQQQTQQPPQQPQQPQQQPQQEEGEPQEGQGEGQEESQEEGQEEGQGGEPAEGEAGGDGKPQAGEGEGEPADAGPVTLPVSERTLAHEVEPTMRPQGGAPGGSYTRNEVLTNGTPSMHRVNTWGGDAKVPPALRYQVRRLFENSAREWREGGFKSGTLHRAALPKVATGAREVFARRFSADGVDSAVAIVLDISGSMYPGDDDTLSFVPTTRRQQVEGSRMDVAVGACIALMDTLAAAGAESMVMAFGQDSHIVKPFSMPWRKAAAMLQRIRLQGDTNDYAATRFATEALIRHPAERKVMIALTDGQGEVWRTSQQRQAAEALGIRIIGIGIQEHVGDTWGSDSVMIRKVSDLGSVAFGKMKAAA